MIKSKEKIKCIHKTIKSSNKWKIKTKEINHKMTKSKNGKVNTYIYLKY